MNIKAVIGVIIVAVLIGVLYVVFEKNFFGGKAIGKSETSSYQELPKDSPNQPSMINVPSPNPTLPPINESSNLSQEASSLQMRDYSTMFEDLKGKVKE